MDEIETDKIKEVDNTVQGVKNIPDVQMKTIQIPTMQLIHFEKNLNQMEPTKFDSLKESIAKIGILEPLFVNKRNNEMYVVLDGNHRLEAAIELGIQSLPCRVLEVPSNEELQYNLHFNEFRGELQINLISNEVDKMITKGLSITEIGKILNLSDDRVLRYADFAKARPEFLKMLQDSLSNEDICFPLILPSSVAKRVMGGVNVHNRIFNEQLYYKALGRIMGHLFIILFENRMSELKRMTIKRDNKKEGVMKHPSPIKQLTDIIKEAVEGHEKRVALATKILKCSHCRASVSSEVSYDTTIDGEIFCRSCIAEQKERSNKKEIVEKFN